MRFLLKPLRLIYCIYAYTLFVALMLLIFPFAIIASFFGRIRGGNMILGLCRLWADIWFPMIFIFHKRIYEAPLHRDRPYIFVSNHISYLDAAILMKAYRRPFRPLGKIEMSRIPVFGFIYRNAIVTVDRSHAAQRARSVRILKSLLGKGISIMVFPEGTFNMTDKPLKSFYDGAFRIAIETGTPIKPVLFLDARERMDHRHLFTLTPGRSRLLYMPEITVTGLRPEDLGALKSKVYEAMEEALLRYR